jgi:hypothetical protein
LAGAEVFATGFAVVFFAVGVAFLAAGLEVLVVGLPVFAGSFLTAIS